MRAKLLGIVLTTPIAISSFASTETISFTPDNINADISLGTLSGKTKERVYLAEEGGRKVSQLDWKFNNAAIIKGAINWDLMPRYLLGLRAGLLSAAEVAIWSIRTGWIPVTRNLDR